MRVHARVRVRVLVHVNMRLCVCAQVILVAFKLPLKVTRTEEGFHAEWDEDSVLNSEALNLPLRAIWVRACVHAWTWRSCTCMRLHEPVDVLALVPMLARSRV